MSDALTFFDASHDELTPPLAFRPGERLEVASARAELIDLEVGTDHEHDMGVAARGERAASYTFSLAEQAPLIVTTEARPAFACDDFASCEGGNITTARSVAVMP